MSEQPSDAPFIFVCYRREDSSGYAGRLHDALVGRFGTGEAFMDVAAIPPGADFVRHVEAAIGSCRAVLVVIGPHWLTAGAPGGRRLDDPEDTVRLEVEAALRREVLVIPVLVQGAEMPRPAELPESIRALAVRNAVELSDTRWGVDVGRLGDVLTKLRPPVPPNAQHAQAWPAPSGDTPALPAMSAPETAATLVGRAAEMERIEAAVADIARGEPRLLVILGEAGIGKTALTLAAAARVRAGGGRIMAGSCMDIGDGGLPYLPVAQALRGLARTTPTNELARLLGPARAELALIAPELDPGGASTPHPTLETDTVAPPTGTSQARLYERFIGLLARLGADGPCLMIVDDVQWIDRATRDLLTFVVRSLTTERVGIMLTCRSDDLLQGHPVLAWLTELGRSPGAERLEIGRLDRGGVDQMLSNLMGGPVDADLAGRVWRRSDGNPLFVEELLAAELAGPPVRDRRPTSLEETLVARLAGLAPSSRRLLDAISVVGRPLSEGSMTVLLGPDHVEVPAALRDTMAHNILVPVADGDGYGFRQELVREVVERALLPSERRAFHRRVAELLEANPDMALRSPADAAAELASHWIEAGRVIEAHRASIDAARAAEAVHAFSAALAYLERAIDLESRLPDSARPIAAERLALRRRAADMADVSGEFGRAMELNRDALGMVDHEADPASSGIIRGRLGYLTWLMGDLDGAIAEHEAAVGLVPAEPPSAERAHVLGGLGGALMAAGRWAESRTVCEAAIACAVTLHNGAEESRARNMLGSDLVSLGEVAAGIEQLRRARELATGAGPPDLLILSHHNLAINLVQADLLAEALVEARDGRAAARSAGLERRFGQDLAALMADVLLRLGRWAEADAATREGLALAQPRSVTIYLAAVRARLAALRGDAPEAVERLAPLDGLTLDPDVASYVGQVRAEAALADRRPGDAQLAVAEGLARLEGLDDVLWAAPLVALGVRAAAEAAEAARAQGDDVDRARAERDAAGLIERANRLGERTATNTSRAWVALAHAEATRVAGRADPAAWIAVRDLWAGLGDPFATAYGRLRLAEAALAGDGDTDVEAELKAADQAARALGAEPLRRQIKAVSSQARISVGQSAPAEAGPPIAAGGAAAHSLGYARACALSGRENEVLAFIAGGLSNRQIAERLAITPKAAAVRVTQVLRALGVSTRAEAATAAGQLGLAGPPNRGSEA